MEQQRLRVRQEGGSTLTLKPMLNDPQMVSGKRNWRQ